MAHSPNSSNNLSTRMAHISTETRNDTSLTGKERQNKDLTPGTNLMTSPQFFTNAKGQVFHHATFNAANVMHNTYIDIKSEKPRVPAGHKKGMSSLPESTPNFVGRKDVISALQDHFLQGTRSLELNRQKFFLLYGLGGAGKTQIALEFARQFNKEFCNIFLIHSASEDLIQASFYDISCEKNLPEQTWESGFRWLELQEQECLLIYDNADDPTLEVSKYMCRSRFENIIITSRNSTLVQLAVGSTGKAMEIRDMDHADAVQLLLSYAGIHEESCEELYVAGEIANELHNFALAIVQAGSYIQQQQCLFGYMERLKSQRAHLLAKNMTHKRDNYTLSTYSTWNLSWQKLNHASQQFLQICSCMHFENIPRQMFQRAMEHIGHITLPLGPSTIFAKTREVLSQIFNTTEHWNDLIMDDILNNLKSYSLIEILQHGTLYSIHPLVHQWVFDENRGREDILLGAKGIIAASVRYATRRDMIFLRLIGTHSINIVPLPADEHHVLEAIDNMCYITGNLHQTLKPRRHLVDVYTHSLGSDHPDTLGSITNLAATYRNLGMFQDAIELEEPLVDTSKRVMGEEHPLTLNRMTRLANTYRSLGRLQQALKIEEPLLQVSRRVLGDEHLDTLTHINNLAYTYKYLGQYQKAFELEEPLVKASKHALGEKHPDTLTRIGNLAYTYGKLGLLQKSLEIEEPLVESFKQVLGKEHVDTLTYMSNLAYTYRRLGRFDKALSIQEPLLETSKKVLGEKHPATFTRMCNLAESYADCQRFQEALLLQEPLLQTFKQSVGEKHPDTVAHTRNLAYLYWTLKRFSDAADLQKPLLKTLKEIHGKDNPETLTCMNNLASTYQKLGRYNEALELQEPLLVVSRQVLGAEHPDTLTRMANLVSTYMLLAKPYDALKLQKKLLGASIKVYGKSNTITVAHVNSLLNINRALNKKKGQVV